MRIDPQLADFLTERDLGTLVPDSGREQLGRNSNFLVDTDAGRTLFVKRVHVGTTEAKERFDSCLAFERIRRDDASVGSALGTAALLAADDERGFLAYEAVPEAQSLAERAADEAVTPEEVAATARVLATLHSMPADRIPERSSELAMPPVGWLTALPWGAYARSSAPSLQVWRRLQGDDDLRQAVTELRRDERAVRPRAIHGDVRLDQFLVGADGVVRLIDLEEFRLGDPARDVGAMVGEWLHRATLDLVDQDARSSAVTDLELSHEDVLAGGARALEKRRPSIQTFWRTYRDEAGLGSDDDFTARVTRFAGWHLIDRLLASSEMTSRLSALQWAAAGIGRQALLHPLPASQALGLTDDSTTTSTSKEQVA